jgi:hypothetical protein
VHDDADAEAEELVDAPHPFGVAAGEVVVDGDDMHALAGERVEIAGERGDQRLAFAGAHLGDRAFVQHHAADELHVEMALAERALGRLAHGGEGGRQFLVAERGSSQPLLPAIGENEKLADTPEFKKRLEFMREKALMETELSRIARTAATEDAIKKTYEEAKAKQKPEDEVRAKHILVEKEDEARDVVKRLKAGEDFAKVAKDVSKDPGSEGGDLGWFSKERMVPEFSDAAFKLAPGQLSDPVKSQFGWHVIKVEEKRQKPFPTLEQVKDQVLRYVVQKAQSEVVLKLRESAKIERMEGAPAPTLVPPAAKPEEKK